MVKVKLFLCFNWAPHCEGVLRGVEVQLHASFDLGTSWRWVVSFMPRPLYPQGKSPLYPLYRRLGGRQSRSGRGGEEKNSQPLPGLEPPIIQLVVHRYTTELSRLLFIIIYAYKYVSNFVRKFVTPTELLATLPSHVTECRRLDSALWKLLVLRYKVISFGVFV
jgi:hypothetical protein